MVNTNDLNMMAQDFFDAYVDDYAVNDKVMIEVIKELINFWESGQTGSLKPEATRLLVALLSYTNYQLQTRIQSQNTGDPSFSPKTKTVQANPPSLD
tara:strand:- start:107 stop:397 length:291 start_codon:yes stop_codon:yes gene_type:complete